MKAIGRALMVWLFGPAWAEPKSEKDLIEERARAIIEADREYERRKALDARVQKRVEEIKRSLKASQSSID
jgi:hypothetical protein